MGTTNARRYPYPEATDPVSAGPTAIANLARALDEDHTLMVGSTVGDWLTAAAGWALVSGEIASYAGWTQVRLTVRRTGASLWTSQTTGGLAAPVLLATFRSGVQRDRPAPFTTAALSPGPPAHGSAEDPRGGRAVVLSGGEIHLYGVDAIGGLALEQNTTVALTGAYLNAAAYGR